MPGIVQPSEYEREKLAKKQGKFREKCKEEDIVDPPQNTTQTIACSVKRILTFPRDPRIY